MDNIIKNDEYVPLFIQLEKLNDPCPDCGNTMYNTNAGTCCFFCGYNSHIIKGEHNE